MAAGTILVIAVNSRERQELVTVLLQQGYRVLTANDGNEALNRLSSAPVPDLILLDLHIPTEHCDGWWFLKQRQRIADLTAVPVILLTSLSVASKASAASRGAAGLLGKPFDAAALQAEIQRCLGDRDAHGP